MQDSSRTSLLEVRRDDGIVLLQFANSTGYPRLERAVLESLHKRFVALRCNPEIRGVVITGTEKSFAAGAEIRELSSLTANEARKFSEMGQRVMAIIANFSRPVVAAIRGHCLGGGLDLALACHVRLATEDTLFGHPGGALGIMTGWGGTARLPRLIGRSRALEIFSTGRTIPASEALAWGLVRRIVAAEKLLSLSYSEIS